MDTIMELLLSCHGLLNFMDVLKGSKRGQDRPDYEATGQNTEL